MNRIRLFFKSIGDYFSHIPLKSYVTFILEALGLFANLIAVATFLGAINTPKESPNFYINSQEFFVWSLIAMIYVFGLISARIKRRWRRKMLERGYVVKDYNLGTQTIFARSNLHWDMFQRDFSFTLAASFILTFLYVRAMQAALTEGTASPWSAFGMTLLVWIPVTFGVMIMSSIIDKALSLYEGD
jgi:hypothetical protein